MKKTGRKYTLPIISFTSDLVLFILSIIFINHVVSNLNYNLDWVGMSKQEYVYRLMDNYINHISFKFEYIFCVMISCLLLNLINIVQFLSEIGPLVKIVEKMLGDFLNFMILYFILIIMFAIVGSSNFVYDLE